MADVKQEVRELSQIRKRAKRFKRAKRKNPEQELSDELNEALMYLRACRAMLCEPKGGFLPGGMSDFLKKHDKRNAFHVPESRE